MARAVAGKTPSSRPRPACQSKGRNLEWRAQRRLDRGPLVRLSAPFDVIDAGSADDRDFCGGHGEAL